MILRLVIHLILLSGQMAARIQLLEDSRSGGCTTASVGNSITMLLRNCSTGSAFLLLHLGPIVLVTVVLGAIVLLDLGIDDLDLSWAVRCQHAPLRLLWLRAVVKVVLERVRVGLHWLVLSLGEGLVFVCLSLAGLTLGSDFLSEHFTLFCADEPWV